MTLIRPQHVYNDILELIFELGLGAIPLWFLLAFAIERGNNEERIIVFCFFVMSLTYFPLYIPPIGQLFFAVLGRMTRSYKWQGFGLRTNTI